MNSKLIAIISSEFPPGPGGIGKHAYDLSQALAWKGYQVTVFTSQDYSNQNEIDVFNASIDKKITLNVVPRTGYSTYFNRWKIIHGYLQKNIPSMVIVTGRFSLWMGFLINKRFGNKIKVHAFLHGSELYNKNRLFNYFTKKSLQQIDFLWAVSAFTRNQLLKITQRDDIKIMPNGLWMNDWIPAQKSLDNFTLQGYPSLITVGRVSNRKGQHRVVKALPLIHASFENVHYHMAGISTGKERVAELAKKLDAGNLITFHGRISVDSLLAQYYQSAHIFIMLSENQKDGDIEGFGIAILEANYFGKPAIGAKGCGIEDAIIDGYNGILVDGDDANEINEAIKEIMINYEAFSSRARNWANKHDWKILVERFMNEEDITEEGKIAFTN